MVRSWTQLILNCRQRQLFGAPFLLKLDDLYIHSVNICGIPGIIQVRAAYETPADHKTTSRLSTRHPRHLTCRSQSQLASRSPDIDLTTPWFHDPRRRAPPKRPALWWPKLSQKTWTSVLQVEITHWQVHRSLAAWGNQPHDSRTSLPTSESAISSPASTILRHVVSFMPSRSPRSMPRMVGISPVPKCVGTWRHPRHRTGNFVEVSLRINTLQKSPALVPHGYRYIDNAVCLCANHALQCFFVNIL
jgi:hypothetical protein